MKEESLYIIELTGDECAEIVTEHVTKLLKAKGYSLKFSMRSDNEFWPSVEFTGTSTSRLSDKPAGDDRG